VNRRESDSVIDNSHRSEGYSSTGTRSLYQDLANCWARMTTSGQKQPFLPNSGEWRLRGVKRTLELGECPLLSADSIGGCNT
jgi:hypothetical protein